MKHQAFATRRMFGLAACAGLATFLVSCGQQHRPGERPALVQRVQNNGQLEDVISALKQGDVKRARKMLKGMTRRDPADRRVATLIEGLDGDPLKILGVVSFNYRVESGEQLTTLAQRFLNNRLRFFLLARYNHLAKDSLQSGQVIRIPGIAPAPKVRAEPRLDLRPEPRPKLPTPLPSTTPSPPGANPAAAGRLRAQALAALNRGAVANAAVMLRRANALDPTNLLITSDLRRAERLLAAVKARR